MFNLSHRTVFIAFPIISFIFAVSITAIADYGRIDVFLSANSSAIVNMFMLIVPPCSFIKLMRQEIIVSYLAKKHLDS